MALLHPRLLVRFESIQLLKLQITSISVMFQTVMKVIRDNFNNKGQIFETV